MNYINKGKRDILIFPKFRNIEKIQEIRKKYDELYSIIPPHITIAFPFEKDITNEELELQLRSIIINFKPFKIKCNGISLREDRSANTNYIFLNITEGKNVIKEMHDKIYKMILPDIDISKYTYEPHITLGTTNNCNENIELNDEFETIVDMVAIEQIGENEESIIISEIKLK